MPNWTVRYQAKDMSAVYEFMTKRIGEKIPFRWIPKLVGGIYGLVFSMALFSLWKVAYTEYVPYANWFLALFSTAFVLGLIISPICTRHWSRGLVHIWGADSQLTVITLDERGITLEGDSGLTYAPWRAIDEIVEFSGYLYFTYRTAYIYAPILGFSTPDAYADFKSQAFAFHQTLGENS
jgi:hypothetical protein